MRKVGRILLYLICFEIILQVLSLPFIRDYIVSQKDTEIRTDESEFAILCVGNSCTFGVGAPRNKSYPSQLYSFMKDTGKSCTLFNRGVPGANSTQVAQIFEESLVRYRPDCAIVLMGANDIWNLVDVENFRAILKNRDIPLIIAYFFRYSKLYRLISNYYRWFFSYNAYKKTDYVSVSNHLLEKSINRKLIYNTEASENKWEGLTVLGEILGKNIDRIEDAGRNYGVQVFYLLYPSPNANNTLLKDTLLNKGLRDRIIDTAKVFDSSDGLFSSDGFHPNQKGYGLMAGTIFSFLEDNTFLDLEGEHTEHIKGK
ncbi:SGNH/GDSL hydrolase family protein [Candidatus Omnitrophota bacterium]